MLFRSEIKAYVDTLPGFEKIRFRKQRYGQTSGSVFEFVIQENDDKKRDQLVQNVITALEKHPDITNVEPDMIRNQKEYRLDFDQSQLKRLAVNPLQVASSLRTIVNGSQLYTLIRNNEEINVNLTVDTQYQDSINNILKIPVQNNQNYLVPLEDLVAVNPIQAKKSIRHKIGRAHV